MTTSDFIRAIGREALAQRVGVSPSRVRRAEHEATLPAAWWVEAKALAEASGVECPQALFSFKTNGAAA